MTALEALGCEVGLCGAIPEILTAFGTSGWRIWQTLWILGRIKKEDVIVAVHEVSALLFLAARRLGLLRNPVFILNLALLHPKNHSGLRGLVWRRLLRGADRIVSLVESQLPGIHGIFGVPLDKQTYLPMLVDCSFFTQADASREERFILAVGTNDGKDFETLLESLPLGERLVVVTDSYNAAKIRKHKSFGAGVEVLQHVPALELLNWYRRARVVVIPLADTPHGSGHTVFLENMALGKILVVSESRSMRGYARGGINCISVPVGNVRALREALQSVLDTPGDFHFLRENAVREARSLFIETNFAAAIRDLARCCHAGDERSGAERPGPIHERRQDHASIP
jgi:glycosyltransferase involved in cell wall biosynthesis